MMNLQRGTRLRNLLANLQVFAGSLLVLGAVAHALLTGFTTPEGNPSALCSSSGEMLPIPGGSSSLPIPGGPVSVPEIDPGSAGQAIALLIGGLLVLGGMRSKRAAPPE
jgi:hypothetical protein